MIACLSLVVLFAPQDPAAETKALEAAARKWAEVSVRLHRSLPLGEVASEAEETLFPALTGPALQRQRKRAKEQRTNFGRNIPKGAWSTRVVAIEEAPEGARAVSVEITHGKDVRKHRYLFTRAGGKWLLRAAFNPCGPCSGSGACTPCAKRPAAGAVCWSCKGTQVCRSCEGKKQSAQELTVVGLPLLKPKQTFAVAPDYSTPRKAAETFLRLLKRRELVLLQRLGAWARKAFATMRPLLAPQVVKAIDANVAKAEAEGTKRFQAWKAELLSVEQEPDAAFAAIKVPPQGLVAFARGLSGKRRLALVRSGAGWKVDRIERPCFRCSGKPRGPCAACNDTGWRPRR